MSTTAPQLPIWDRFFKHCQSRAEERLNLNLSLDLYFNLVNGRITGCEIARNKGAIYRKYVGIPGVWMCRGKWPRTVFDNEALVKKGLFWRLHP